MTDTAEPSLSVQAKAGSVLAEDAGLNGPHADFVAGGGERIEELSFESTDACAFGDAH